MPMPVSCSAVAPAPDRTPSWCSRAITTVASIVTFAPSAAGPMSRRLLDEEAVVSTPSINAAGRHAFAPSHVHQRIESAPARGAAPVHVVARAGEHRTRDYGAHRLGAASRRLGGGHITPRRVLQGNRRRRSANPCPVNGLRPSGFPGEHKISMRQLVCFQRVTAAAMSTSRGASERSHARETEQETARLCDKTLRKLLAEEEICTDVALRPSPFD